MNKKNLNPKKAEGTASVQKIIPIGQDVPQEGLEVKHGQIQKSSLDGVTQSKDLWGVKSGEVKLDEVAAKDNPGDSMNLKGVPPSKIGPVKREFDKNYKMQVKEIASKKKDR